MSTLLLKNKKLTVDAEKNIVAMKLLSLKDENLVHTINLILDDLTSSTKKRSTIANYNKEIDSAVKRVKNGKSISNDDAMQQMNKW